MTQVATHDTSHARVNHPFTPHRTTAVLTPASTPSLSKMAVGAHGGGGAVGSSTQTDPSRQGRFHGTHSSQDTQAFPAASCRHTKLQHHHTSCRLGTSATATQADITAQWCVHPDLDKELRASRCRKPLNTSQSRHAQHNLNSSVLLTTNKPRHKIMVPHDNNHHHRYLHMYSILSYRLLVIGHHSHDILQDHRDSRRWTGPVSHQQTGGWHHDGRPPSPPGGCSPPDMMGRWSAPGHVNVTLGAWTGVALPSPPGHVSPPPSPPPSRGPQPQHPHSACSSGATSVPVLQFTRGSPTSYETPQFHSSHNQQPVAARAVTSPPRWSLNRSSADACQDNRGAQAGTLTSSSLTTCPPIHIQSN